MKSFACALISTLAWSAAAKPFPNPSEIRVNGRATVTAAEVEDLKLYAQYAAAGYCNAESAIGSTVTCSAGNCPDVTAAGATIDATFSGVITDLQGFVSTDDTNQLIVVSFKGSHSIRNWITDFVFLQVGCDVVDGCLVHLGFLTGYEEVAEALLAGLATAAAANPSYAIVFTGHSLGGAVGTIAAAYARAAGYAVDLVTFGSPRVGNKAFVEFVTDQAGAERRVTHLSDPVPKLPPILLNYRHTSPELWLSTGETNTTDYAASDIKVCEGFATLGCNAGTLEFDADAHTYYFEDISACADEGTEFRRRRSEENNNNNSDKNVVRREVTQDMATSPPQDVTDEELQAKLAEWVQQDIEFAADLDE
ncbi:alpha/beta-hydrolase [Xylariomycetidae sp. FL2044]|nr:alpha/beta-hydrolase [Xylariomycetidae sp. FL2044]